MNEDLQRAIDQMHALHDEIGRMPITVSEYRYGDERVRRWIVRACEAVAPNVTHDDQMRGVLGDLFGIRIIEDKEVPDNHLRIVYSNGKSELRRIVPPVTPSGLVRR